MLGVREEPDRPLLQTLCAHLKTRRALLILDNCEHVIQASARLASAILSAAPHVRILASSREALHAPGEQCYPVLPLPVPRRGDGLEALSRSTAVRLFVERAQLHKPAFALTEREAPAVAELVARLEGIPLALELAAARIRALSVADINARLKDRYKLLTGGVRVLQERQQTLRALVDWSYELLESDEQIVLDRLGVFVGGFDLAAAEAVCGAEPLAGRGRARPARLAGREVAGDARRARRWRPLPACSTRSANTRARSWRSAATTRRRPRRGTASTTSRWPRRRRDGLKGPQQADWLWQVEIELDNMRGAIALSLAGGVDPIIAVKFAVAMQGFWILRGYSSEGPQAACRRRWRCRRSRRRRSPRRFALYVGAALAESQSDHAEARKMLETCLELRRGAGQRGRHRRDAVDAVAGPPAGGRRRRGRRRARARRCRSSGASATASAKRSACCISARSACTRATTRWLARTWSSAWQSPAKSATRRSRASASCCSARWRSKWTTATQAGLRFKRSLTVCREAGDKRGEANALRWLARVDLQAGDLASARPACPTPCAPSEPSRCARSCSVASRTTPSSPRRRARLEVAVGAGGRGGPVARTARPEAFAAGRAAVAGAHRRLRRAMTDGPFDSAWDKAQRMADRRGHPASAVGAERTGHRLDQARRRDA